MKKLWTPPCSLAEMPGLRSLLRADPLKSLPTTNQLLILGEMHLRVDLPGETTRRLAEVLAEEALPLTTSTEEEVAEEATAEIAEMISVAHAVATSEEEVVAVAITTTVEMTLVVLEEVAEAMEAMAIGTTTSVEVEEAVVDTAIATTTHLEEVVEAAEADTATATIMISEARAGVA